jgi:phosphatidylglycerophosphate synthase
MSGRASSTASTETLRGTIDRLVSYQKPSKGAPAYSRFVNRPLGRFLAAVSYRYGLSPDAVTAISGALSLGGVLLLFLATPAHVVALGVALLLVLGYAFDSADGQLARLRGGGSAAGEWLDHVVDCAKINLLHIAVLVGLSRTGLDRAWLALPLAYVAVANLFFFTFILGDLLKRSAGASPQPVDARAPVLRSVLTVPTDYGLLCLTFVLWGRPSFFVVAYGLLLLGNVGYLALGLPRWFRDVKAVDALVQQP